MTLTEILQKYNVPYRAAGDDKNVRDGFIGLHCPFCARPDDKFYLGYSLQNHFFSCWSCGYLPPAKALAGLLSLPEWECRKLLGSLELPERAPPRPAGRLKIPQHVHSLERPFQDYLEFRGFNPAKLEKLWKLGGIGALGGRLAWRIFIPVFQFGKLVTWTTRTIGNREPRYISAPAEDETIPIRHTLYGFDYVRHATIIHEGPADVWATGPGACATYGLGFSAQQVLLLSRIPLRGICFDNEPAAQRRAQQLCDQLAGFPGETVNIRLDAKDSAAAGPKELRKLREFLG